MAKASRSQGITPKSSSSGCGPVPPMPPCGRNVGYDDGSSVPNLRGDVVPRRRRRGRGNVIRAPSRTGSAAACSGQAWIAARRPRPAVGVVSLCNCARRCGGGARLSHSSITRMTLPVEHAALPGRRVARASLKPRNCRCLLELRQAKSTYGDTAACRRHEGQAQHVDHSSSCVGRLVPVSEPRYLAPDTLQGLAGETARSCGGAPEAHAQSGPP